MADDELRESAQVLYATAPSTFIAARGERVRELRAAGHDSVARQVAAFKKPSTGADAVNRLVRADRELAADIADLGGRLRAAQALAPVPAELRALDQERRALVNRARDAARQADDGSTAATLDHVEQTVWAALVDARAAAIVLAGVLVRPLSPGGFGEVDTDGASAVPVDALPEDLPRRRPAPKKSSNAQVPDAKAAAKDRRAEQKAAEERKAAEAALAAAQDASRAASKEVEAATRTADDAVQQRADLERERDELRERITAVEHAVRESRTTIDESRAALRLAERRRRDAAAEVDRAVRRVDQAT